MSEEPKNSFDLQALWYRIKVLLSGTGLGIYPLLVFSIGILLLSAFIALIISFKNFPLIGIIGFCIFVYALVELGKIIFPAIERLAGKKSSLPLFLPENKIYSAFLAIYGDKSKPLREISNEKSYTLEALKSEKLSLEEGDIIPKMK